MGLVLKNVSKDFAGKRVVDRISFQMDTPGTYGLLGTNGAGKTTTIRMLLGIIRKDSGDITWNGIPVDRKNVNFGYLPEERGVYPKVKILTQLLYFAELKGMAETAAATAITRWAERLKITEYLGQPAEKLSKGNQQKVQFLTAVIHDPDLLVLDEPFSGLDPVNTELIKDIIVELVARGKYVIMSAHQMSTIEEFCNDILILNRGKTVLQGNLQDIKASYPANRVLLNTDQPVEKYLHKFEIERATDHQYSIKIKNEKSAHDLLQKLVNDDITVNRFEIMKPTLNDIFIEKVGANHA